MEVIRHEAVRNCCEPVVDQCTQEFATSANHALGERKHGPALFDANREEKPSEPAIALR